MNSRIKIIAQEIDNKTNQLISEHIIYEKKTTAPARINDLGFSHKEQIAILYHSQEAILTAQEKLINEKNNTCPKCSKKTKKSGKFESDFHSVFTDHKISLQRSSCTCGWKSKISVDGTYASALHPDLVEMQCLIGSQASFKKTEEFLAKKCCASRPINNHSRIQTTIHQVGELLRTMKQTPTWVAANEETISDALILTIDGGHLPSNDTEKPSFEALVATVFDPKNIIKKDKHHAKITHKTVVASAKSDHQTSLKKMIKNACKKQGMNETTTITLLTDGAKNCWSAVSGIEDECKEVIKILDWFHIGKKFKNNEHVVPEELKEEYERAKWCLWHGDAEKSLKKLTEIKNKMPEDKLKIGGLITYIKNNQSCIIDYQERQARNLIFTSQLAESSINNLINERQKHDKRMQWSRTGADAVLQIRASKQSEEWESDWTIVQNRIYREAC